MVIGPIAASRGNEREVVGTGSLLEVREDQRSAAIAILPGASPSTVRKLSLPELPLGYPHSCRRSRWAVEPPTKKTPANHRHERHDRHPSEEAACPSRFLGDDHRDGGVTVTRVPDRDRHEETP